MAGHALEGGAILQGCNTPLALAGLLDPSLVTLAPSCPAGLYVFASLCGRV